MNQITAALKTAGVVLPPMNRRIWQWLHDKGGGYTTTEIATALKLPNNTTASVLFDMETRGMVRTGQYKRTAKKKRGVPPREWFTVGSAFELLPVKPEFKAPTAAQLRRAAASTPPAGKDTPVAPAPATAIKTYDGPTPVPNIDAMTVREARALYNQLHKMFGPTS